MLEPIGKATAGEAMAKPLKNASLPQLNITRFTLPCQDKLKILRIKESLSNRGAISVLSVLFAIMRIFVSFFASGFCKIAIIFYSLR